MMSKQRSKMAGPVQAFFTAILLLCLWLPASSGFLLSACPIRSHVTQIFAAESRDGTLQISKTFHVPASKGNKNDANPEMNIEEVTEVFDLAYKIFRPMTMSSRQAAPILVLHGGPSVPSDYLYPLVDVVPYRSIVFYDQLGCGRSDEPDAVDAYSIENAVDDLERLVKKLGMRQFHLFGQSYGGILGYEFLKRRAEQNEDDPEHKVLSFTISSTPTSVSQVEGEVQGLLETLLEEDDDQSTVEDRFQQTHICRTPEKPQALVDAYAHAGTVWRGSNAILDYVAEPPSDKAGPLPPAMIMRGEHDFVTEVCSKDWKEKLWNQKRIREKIIDGCSHHGLLEQPLLYGDILDSYCTEYDP